MPEKKQATTRRKQPWYAEGLRFECQPDCGACCTDHGDYAYVYLEEDDVTRLAEHLGLGLADFAERYTDDDEGFVMLKMDGPDCPFLEGLRCGVYEARPRQCKTFPFWDEGLASPKAWKRLREFCPGIDQGPVHSLPVIQAHLDRSEPDE